MNKPIFDKTNWVKITFGDIAREVKESSRNPLADGFKYFVGLDHMDSDDLQLHRWGELSKGISFTRVFRKGQILFGRRRAYQKKAVIAPFDGICSGDILVFEPITDYVLPEFFPHVIQNDKFFEYAVKTSAGSLSPRTKFKDLALLRLVIPSIPIQQEIKSLLISVNYLTSKLKLLEEKTKNLKNIYRINAFLNNSYYKNKAYSNNQWEIVPFSNVFQRVTTKNHKDNKNVLTISAKYGLINQNDFFSSKVSGKDLKNYYLLKNGDFAYNKSYSDGYPMGAIKRLNNIEEGVVSPLYICFSMYIEDANPKFYEQFFESGLFNRQISSVAQEGARNHGLLNVGVSDFFNLNVPKPNIATQDEIVNQLSEIDVKINLITEFRLKSQKLREIIYNLIF